VDDLVVDSHLDTIVSDDEDADAATAVVERLGKALEEVALVEDGKTLLDITSLSHGNNTVILANVQDTVLLEDRAEHVLDDDRGGWVGDEAGLFMELLGEEVNTEVTVLASLRRGGDADDLARAALKDQEIANADVVAGDGDGVGRRHGAGGDAASGSSSDGVGADGGVDPLDWARDGDGGDGGADGSRGRGGVLFADYNFLAVVVVS